MKNFARYPFESSEPERLAYTLAHAAFAAVRSLEIIETFGFDIREAEAQAHQIRTPRNSREVDLALQRLRSRERARSSGFVNAGLAADATLPADAQGETQIGFDVAAMAAMMQVANMHGIPVLGEEDEYREHGDEAVRLRAGRIRSLVQNDLAFAITDPLDGSNQAAGMSQRSGWGSCALVRTPGLPKMSAAVILGDGRSYVSGEGGVWMSEASDPDRTPVSYFITPKLYDPGFERPHFILPASKNTLVARTHKIMEGTDSVKWISPLGGNPGILAGMLGGQAVAAMQPTAFAWDHMAAFILASAGFTVMNSDSDDSLSAQEVSDMLLLDLASGRKTGTMYIGRTRELTLQIKNADGTARRNSLKER